MCCRKGTQMTLNRQIVLTGPPGSGKSTVLDLLKESRTVVPEAARRVLARERASGGRGTGEQDPALFVSLMLDLACRDYDETKNTDQTVIFDRSVPDLIGFAAHYDLDNSATLQACSTRPLTFVFWFPHWPEIYTQDAERRATADEATAVGNHVRNGYESLGYDLIDVPQIAPSARAEFIMSRVGH